MFRFCVRRFVRLVVGSHSNALNPYGVTSYIAAACRVLCNSLCGNDLRRAKSENSVRESCQKGENHAKKNKWAKTTGA